MSQPNSSSIQHSSIQHSSIHETSPSRVKDNSIDSNNNISFNSTAFAEAGDHQNESHSLAAVESIDMSAASKQKLDLFHPDSKEIESHKTVALQSIGTSDPKNSASQVKATLGTTSETIPYTTKIEISKVVVAENTHKNKDFGEKNGTSNKTSGRILRSKAPVDYTEKVTDGESNIELESEKIKVYHENFQNTFKFRFDDNKVMDITEDDFYRLNDGEFLNDTLINFYLKFLLQNLKNFQEDLWKKFHIFNTFFYSSLASSKDKSEILRWSLKADLFSKMYVIIPINHNVHWYFAIIYNLPALLQELPKTEASEDGSHKDSIEFETRVTRNGRHAYKSSRSKPKSKKRLPKEDDCVIFILDSYKSVSYLALRRNLILFINKAAKRNINKDRIFFKQVNVPQQDNLCDCGVYLIHYVEMFLKEPQAIVSSVLTSNDSELSRLLKPAVIAKKRETLKEELLKAKLEAESNNKYQASFGASVNAVVNVVDAEIDSNMNNDINATEKLFNAFSNEKADVDEDEEDIEEIQVVDVTTKKRGRR